MSEQNKPLYVHAIRPNPPRFEGDAPVVVWFRDQPKKGCFQMRIGIATHETDPRNAVRKTALSLANICERWRDECLDIAKDPHIGMRAVTEYQPADADES